MTSNRRGGRRLKRWGGLLACLVIALWGADFFVYQMYLSVRDDIHGLFVADEARGYALTPGFRKTIIKGYPFPVEINSRGYRGSEWRLDEDFRILVAGNSFVFGLPHPAPDGIVGNMRSLLGPKIGLYNLGVPSYGILQSLMTIRRKCSVIKPRHVVYAMDFNDFRLDHVDARSRTVVDGYQITFWSDDRLSRRAEPLSRVEIDRQIARWNKKKSWSLMSTLRLLNFRTFLAQRHLHPRQFAERLFPGIFFAPGFEKRYVVTDGPEFNSAKIQRISSDAIIEMRNAAVRCGAGFTVVLLPNSTEAYYGLDEPATAAVLRPLKVEDLDILDLRTQVKPSTVLSMPASGYYNAKATKWAADAIVRHLDSLYPRLRMN